MPTFGFYDDGFTITQGAVTATMAQPSTLIPTLSKRVDQYIFRDKTTTTVDAGKIADRLTLTGVDFYSSGNMQFINTMMDTGKRVLIANLATVTGTDTGYTGYYYITNFTYTRKAGVMLKDYYTLVLDSEA